MLCNSLFLVAVRFLFLFCSRFVCAFESKGFGNTFMCCCAWPSLTHTFSPQQRFKKSRQVGDINQAWDLYCSVCVTLPLYFFLFSFCSRSVMVVVSVDAFHFSVFLAFLFFLSCIHLFSPFPSQLNRFSNAPKLLLVTWPLWSSNTLLRNCLLHVTLSLLFQVLVFRCFFLAFWLGEMFDLSQS